MTFWDTIQRGEYVMFALAALLLVALCIWWVRASRLSSQKKKYIPMMERIRDYMMEGDVENAKSMCAVSRTPGARMISAGLRRLGHPMPEVSSALHEVMGVEQSQMDKGCGWLRAIAVISPLLGLGGTLVGITDGLRDLGESGVQVDTAMICSSIAPAIVTTVAGLVVGIFAVIAMTALEASVRSARQRLAELGVEFLDLLNEPV